MKTPETALVRSGPVSGKRDRTAGGQFLVDDPFPISEYCELDLDVVVGYFDALRRRFNPHALPQRFVIGDLRGCPPIWPHPRIL